MSPFKSVGHVQLAICTLANHIGNSASIRLDKMALEGLYAVTEVPETGSVCSETTVVD